MWLQTQLRLLFKMSHWFIKKIYASRYREILSGMRLIAKKNLHLYVKSQLKNMYIIFRPINWAGTKLKSFVTGGREIWLQFLMRTRSRFSQPSHKTMYNIGLAWHPKMKSTTNGAGQIKLLSVILISIMNVRYNKMELNALILQEITRKSTGTITVVSWKETMSAKNNTTLNFLSQWILRYLLRPEKRFANKVIFGLPGFFLLSSSWLSDW